MCATCGCNDGISSVIVKLDTGEQLTLPGNGHSHDHAPGYDHDHEHDHDHGVGHNHDPDHGRDHSRGHGEHQHVHADGTRRQHAHVDKHSHDHDHSLQRAAGHLHEDIQRGRDVALASTIALQREILAKNQLQAERNRGWFAGREILALNLVSSPGSGKTSLLERTLRDLRGQVPISVVEGDQETVNDARRIRAAGAPAIQINTGAGCHLEADQLARALRELGPPPRSIVMIENVGNLVCPALFDLGEFAKVVVLSVTEGEDKPLKYPHMFRASRLMLLNKIDLLPHLEFDLEQCLTFARQVNPDIEALCISARSGEGMQEWYGWLRRHLEQRTLAAAL